MIADVFHIVVESAGQGSALRLGFRFWSRGDDAVTFGGELCFFDSGPVGGVLGVGTGWYAVALTLVPPFDEITSLRMTLVFAIYADAVTAHAAFAVEQGAGVPPVIVDFDLLEEGDVRQFGHKGGSLEEPPIESLISAADASIIRVFDDSGDRAAF